VAGDAAEFAAKVRGLMKPGRAQALGTRARSRVMRDYVWQSSFAQLDRLLDEARLGEAEALAG
jgi:hypothetical protein